MTAVYTVAQMRAWEDAAVTAGSSYATLMENAGARAAADLFSRFEAPQRLLVLCGKGNNGGDGLVLARHWAQAGWPAAVCLLLGENLSPLSAANLANLPPSVQRLPPERLPESDVVVDAVFGTGYSGELPAAVAMLMRQINRQSGCKVALDMPSGINSDHGHIAADSFCAHITYAFQALKPAHRLPEVQAYCGDIVCLSIT
jgi:NAD(P)H-hydrate epimerase